MPQAKRQVELNNFSGGFNTEQSPLNADPSTTVYEKNMVLASDGSRARRYGYSREEGSGSFDFTVGNDLDAQFYQLNNVVSKGTATATDPTKFNNYTMAVGITNGVLNKNDRTVITGTDMTSDVAGAGTPAGGFVNSFDKGMAYINGSYIVPTGLGLTTMSPQPSAESDDWYSYTQRLFIRDLFGIADGLGTGERPSSLTADHAYNLLNQGWSPEAIDKFNTDVGEFPSNGDVPYYGLTTNGTSPATFTYDPERLKQRPFPDGAPKGSFLMRVDLAGHSRFISAQSAFSELNSLLGTSLAVADISDSALSDNTIEWNVRSACSFLGRVFYVGTVTDDTYAASTRAGRYPSMRNALLFSRTVESTQNLSSTYSVMQKAEVANNTHYFCTSVVDPTNEDFAPSPTDGGFLFIDDAEDLIGLYATRQSLLIVATNGVWELIPQDGFSPSSFVLNKILDARIKDCRGVVKVGGAVAIPTASGIYFLQYDGESRRSVATNLSDAKIRTWYNKYNDWIVDGVWDEAKGDVRWLMRTPPLEEDHGEVVVVEQKELILDMRTGSFSVNTFPDTNATVRKLDTYAYPSYADNYAGDPEPFIAGYVKLENSFSTGEEVTPIDTKRNRVQVKLAYIFPNTDASSREYFVADTREHLFTDWGESSDSIMVTAPMTLGDTVRRKDINYLWTHFYRTEDGFEDDGSGDWIPTNPSSCLMSVRWDFSDDDSSGKWSDPKQVYRLTRDYLPADINDPFTYGQSIITTKNQVRGTGKALSVVFSSDGDKDMQLIGWGTELGIEGAV